MYIRNEEVLNFEKVYVYGVGHDAELFYNRFKDKVKIMGFIDTFNFNTLFHDLEVFSPKKCIDIKIKDKIVVASSKYRDEISEDLQLLGLHPGEDYYIWDVNDDFFLDEASERLNDWCRKKWGCYNNEKEENRILIPFENLHDSHVIMYAYLANYLRHKYDAAIDCFIRAGNKVTKQNLKEIYLSFGTSEFLEGDLSVEQKERALVLHNDLWVKIKEFEDWKNITIYGIKFGTTIIRNYQRRYKLTLNCKDEKLKKYLLTCIETIVFWYDRFNDYKYKTVILFDGCHWEGYIRDIAITIGIPTYKMHPKSRCRKMSLNDAWCGDHYKYYNEFWNQLSTMEKIVGVEWAKRKLSERILGNDETINFMGERNPFLQKANDIVIDQNEKEKIMICAHWFDDDSYMYGPQIFDDCYVSWLCHLGELSNKLYQYDWYLKMHPFHGRRDDDFFDIYLNKYQNIKKIPDNISPLQLKEQGIGWALTVQGSIGEEYPLIGIQVINAGANPHVAFDFNWNPRSKKEYDDIIYNIEKLEKKDNIDELYKFYCIDHLYYDYSRRNLDWNFKNIELIKDDFWYELDGESKRVGTWKYDMFFEEYDYEYDQNQLAFIESLFEKMDSYSENIFYKKNIELINEKLFEVGIQQRDF